MIVRPDHMLQAARRFLRISAIALVICYLRKKGRRSFYDIYAPFSFPGHARPKFIAIPQVCISSIANLAVTRLVANFRHLSYSYTASRNIPIFLLINEPLLPRLSLRA